MARVLVAGGYGVVGAWICRELRAAHNDIELVIAGRNPDAGSALADELAAKVARLDVDDPEVGLAEIGPVELVVASLRDPGDNLALAALRGGAAFTSLAGGSETMSTLAIAASLAVRPALVQGYWMAGAVTLAAVVQARRFARVDRIELCALYDYDDPIGPMTASDSSGFFNAALIRRARDWVRVDPSVHARTIARDEAPSLDARPITVLDVAGLAAATDAADIRFDLATGKSLGALSGQAASHDIYIDLWGQDGRSGAPTGRRLVLSDPKGQAHLTALGMLIGAERLLALDGAPALEAGIHFPETSIDPDRALGRLLDFGVSAKELPL